MSVHFFSFELLDGRKDDSFAMTSIVARERIRDSRPRRLLYKLELLESEISQTIDQQSITSKPN